MFSSFGPAEVFIIGADDSIYAQSLDANGAPVGRYFQITGFSVKSVTPGIPFSYELFAIGTDNQVYFQKVTGSGTSTPQDLTPVSSQAPAGGAKALSVGYYTGADRQPRQELFVIGADNQVYLHQFDLNGNPVGDYILIPNGVKAISSAADGTGKPLLFVIGTDDQVYLHKFDSNGMPLGSYMPIPNPVKAISTSSGMGYTNPGLFVIGTDNQVYVHRFDLSGNPVGSYIPIPNPVKAISAVNNLLFVIGTDNLVYVHKFDATGNPSGGYIPLPGRTVTALRASPAPYSPAEVFVIGTDRQLYVHEIDSNGNPINNYLPAHVIEDVPWVNAIGGGLILVVIN
jgi:hypothetical protein